MVSILNKPSSLIHEICIEKVERWKLLKFSASLQQRMENLLEKKKADQLMAEEAIVSAGCGSTKTARGRVDDGWFLETQSGFLYPRAGDLLPSCQRGDRLH